MKRQNHGLPTIPETEDRDVASQEEDSSSLLNSYGVLLKLRKDNPALTEGALRLIPAKRDLLVFERYTDKSQSLTIVNFGRSEVRLNLPEGYGSLLYSTKNTSLRTKGGRVQLIIPGRAGALLSRDLEWTQA